MNERIRELYLEAWFHPPVTTRMGDEYKFEKFAELLIRECAGILVKEVEVALDASGNPVSPEDFIKEHFGVE